MKENYLKWLVGIASAVFIVGGIKLLLPATTTFLGGSIDQFNSVTISKKSVGTSLSQLVGSSGSRRYLGIQNHSANTIFCLLDGDTAAASSLVTSTVGQEVGIRIYPTSTAGGNVMYEIRGYTGSVNCTAPASTTSTLITSP